MVSAKMAVVLLLAISAGPAEGAPPPPPSSNTAVRPAGARMPSAAQGSRVLMGIIRGFCERDFTPEQLVRWLAPRGAVKAGGVLLEPGKAFYIQNEVVTSLNVGAAEVSPYAQVVWWLNPRPPETLVREIHVVADGSGRVVPYRAFVAEHRLGEAEKTEQGGHPLADLLHRHSFSCVGGSNLKLTVSEIVWAGEAVGKIGELTLTR